ncbi:GNAT family N-acetyltransferase [Enterobacter sp. CFBP8995]|nr:GNAT family N-acetyltransferase [Enterobacter sp. CFBP8995]
MNIIIQQSDPLSSESQLLVEKLSAELAVITGDNGKSHFNARELNNEHSLWVLARDEAGTAVGCGALRPLANHTAEVKRMYSDRSVPGVGAALLEYLETRARSMGYREIRLSTRVINSRAVAFYHRSGYAQILNYEPYIGRNESICFAKTL